MTSVRPQLEDMLSSHCNNTVNYFSTYFRKISLSNFRFLALTKYQNTKTKVKKIQSENLNNLKEEKSKSEIPRSQYREKYKGHEAYTPCLTGVGHSRSTTTGMNIKIIPFFTKIYGFFKIFFSPN